MSGVLARDTPCPPEILTLIFIVNGIRNPFKYSPWNKERTLQV